MSPGKIKIQWFSETKYFSELNRIDGKPMEFEWKTIPGFTTVGILNEIQKMMGELQRDPANFKGRIIFMSMFNDIVWDAKGDEELCENNSKKNLKIEKKWYATHNCKPNGSWDRTTEKMMQNFQRSGHPIFRSTSALERGHSRKQRRRKDNNVLHSK